MRTRKSEWTGLDHTTTVDSLTGTGLGRRFPCFDIPAPVKEPPAVLVDAVTFSELLISNRDLQRCDSPCSNQLGLYDSRSGLRYVISEGDLFRAELFRAAL